MTDVEDHAALFRFAHQRQKFARVVDDRRLLRRVAVRDDIAGTQCIGDLIHADGGVADVHHDGRARRLAGLDRQAQRFPTVLADGFLVQADFDTDADVAVTGVYQGRRRMTLTYPILNRARRILWLVTGQDKVTALARLRERNVTIPAGRIQRAAALVLADQAAAGPP